MHRFSSTCLALALVVLLLGPTGCTGEDSTTDVTDDGTIPTDLVHDVAGGDTIPVDTAVPDAASDTEEEVVEAEPVVFSIISDIHLYSGYDHPWSQHVALLVDTMADLEPAPSFLAVTGDLLDTVHEPADTSEGTRIDALRELQANAPLPLHLVMGNHDYYAEDAPVFVLTDDRPARDQLYRDELGIETYWSTVVDGVKLVYVNSMQGPRWNESAGLSGSVGEEQLAWLDAELSDGTPAVVFLHHPPELLLEPDGATTFEDVILSHEANVIAVFAGHLHLFYALDLGGVVPVYLTAWAHEAGSAYHHVEVDPGAMTVTILNEELIGYEELNPAGCSPDEEEPLGDLSSFGGTVQEIVIDQTTTDAGGVGAYLEEGLAMIGFVLSLGSPEPSGAYIPAAMTLGARYGEGAQGLPAYVVPSEGAPCYTESLLVDDPCVETPPVTVEMELTTLLHLSAPDHWQVRVVLEGLTLSGTLSLAGDPHLEGGILETTMDFSPAIEDLRGIVVDEYCAGAIDDCVPGSGSMPVCPDEPDDAFFDEIPFQCDALDMGIGLRMILAVLTTIPEGKGTVVASFHTIQPLLSDQVQVGALHPGVVEGITDGVCPPLE